MKNNVSRRSVVAGVGAIGIAAGLAACGEGNEGNEGAEDGAVQPTTAATGNTNSRVIAAVSDVPVGTAFAFNSPVDGMPAYLMQPAEGTFVCYSAICTHEGCVVNWVQDSTLFLCPCHGAQYDNTGTPTQGPARIPLQKINVAVDGTNVVLA